MAYLIITLINSTIMMTMNRASSLWLLTALAPLAAASDLLLDGAPWDADRWWVQVDGVMGGRSSDSFGVEADGRMVFDGDISLVGGGFTQLRKTLRQPVDLGSYAGIVLELEAHEYENDGAPLGLHLELDDAGSSRYGFSTAFAVPLASSSGETTGVYLPLDRFNRAGFGCWSDSGCGVLDISRISTMNFSVLFQEGRFKVVLKSITAVQEPISFMTPRVNVTSVQSLITSTINRGSALYNDDYRELCSAIYRSTLNTLMGSPTVSQKLKGTICEGLQEAAMLEGNERDVAFRLRYILDDVTALVQNDRENVTAVLGTRQSISDSEEDQCIPVTSFPLVIESHLDWLNEAGANDTAGKYTARY